MNERQQREITLRLIEIRIRVNKATDGPWRYEQSPAFAGHVLGPQSERIALVGTDGNASFIAHAREDIPFLLDLAQENVKIRAELDLAGRMVADLQEESNAYNMGLDVGRETGMHETELALRDWKWHVGKVLERLIYHAQGWRGQTDDLADTIFNARDILANCPPSNK